MSHGDGETSEAQSEKINFIGIRSAWTSSPLSSHQDLHHKSQVGICQIMSVPIPEGEARRGATADQLTKGMAAAQLRLLRVLPVEVRADRVEQLQVALVWPLLQRFDERPAQSAPSLSALEGVRPASA